MHSPFKSHMKNQGKGQDMFILGFFLTKDTLVDRQDPWTELDATGLYRWVTVVELTIVCVAFVY